MTISSKLSHPIAALAAIVVLAGCASAPTPPAAPAAPMRPAVAPAALRTEGLPPIDQALIEATQRYARIAGHGFVQWHPTQREMLVSHRPPGASTSQVFRLRQPLGELEPLTSGAEPVGFARWEPKGRYIVFARGRGGDEAFQLFRLDPATREAVQFTADGQRHGFGDWIGTTGRLVYTSVPLDRTATPGERRELRTRFVEVDPLNPASQRTIAELPGGGWFGLQVAPDDKQASLTRYLSATESEVWLLDLTSGAARKVLPAAGETLKASHFAGGWSKDGRFLLVGSDRAGEFREMLRFEPGSGALTRLTADIPWDVSGGSQSPDGRTVAFTANIDGRDELRLIDPISGRALPVPRVPDGNVNSVSFHETQNQLALLMDSQLGPAQVHVLDTASGQVTAWTKPVGTEGLGLEKLPPQRVVRWKSFDGRTISGILSPAPKSFPGKRPVLMIMHGGPEGQSQLGWLGRMNFLIERFGIAVLEPNVRGSTGYGKTFVGLDNGRLREDSVKDMAAAIDWIAQQSDLDASRVVVLGGSYGGYMALAAATRLADRIAGAQSSVGISNFVSFLENTETYRRDLRRVEYGDERDPAMREFLMSISPLTHADKITKPLLVYQGKNDPRVPWTESEQIVRSLQKRNTPVWYVLAENEGHGISRRENSDFFFATLITFLKMTMKL